MTDFTLLQYDGTNIGSGLGKINTLKKKYKDILGNNDLMMNLESFILSSHKIKFDFIEKMKEIYQEDDEFHFLVPVSSCDYFVHKIKGWISNEFPNSIDISDHFTERNEIDMARLEDNAEESLKQNLVISENLREQNICKIFIGDDVYSSGTSIKVYKDKIQEQFDNKIEFSFGTLIKTQ